LFKDTIQKLESRLEDTKSDKADMSSQVLNLRLEVKALRSELVEKGKDFDKLKIKFDEKVKSHTEHEQCILRLKSEVRSISKDREHQKLRANDLYKKVEQNSKDTQNRLALERKRKLESVKRRWKLEIPPNQTQTN
jgi:chromosome segregation ATPase